MGMKREQTGRNTMQATGQTISQQILDQDIREARRLANSAYTDAPTRRVWEERLNEIKGRDATEHAARELHTLYSHRFGQQATANLDDMTPILDTLEVSFFHRENFLKELRDAGYCELYRTAPPYQFVSFMEDIFNPGWRERAAEEELFQRIADWQ
jgi:hypothetical protein